MLINPVLLTVATVIAMIVGRVSGLNPQLSSVLVAAGVGLVASETALLPIVFKRNAPPVEMFQRAFIGTVLHLGLAAILGTTAVFTLRLGNNFVFWLLGSYWITLTGLCMVFVRVLRAPAKSTERSAN